MRHLLLSETNDLTSIEVKAKNHAQNSTSTEDELKQKEETVALGASPQSPADLISYSQKNLKCSTSEVENEKLKETENLLQVIVNCQEVIIVDF